MAKPFPPGHFYSPVVDVEQCRADSHRIWGDGGTLGVDYNEAHHLHLLNEVFPRYYPDYDYPEMLEESSDLQQFYTRNSQFSWLDSRSLFVLLRHLRPKRIIEVGSGFSSLLTADVNHRFLGDSAHFSCVEPYPREFLRKPIPGLNRLVEERAENLPFAFFAELEANDILFIDSSHVSKTGSDVNHLFFEILPRLRKGVFIHIHDIFLPNDYPKEWVIDDLRSWNEQYLVRALLMYSTTFRIHFGSAFAFHAYPRLVEQALGLESGRAFGGGSLWIQKIQ
jgi:hypothetical protein